MDRVARCAARYILTLGLLFAGVGGDLRAQDIAASADGADWFVWHDLFAPCAGDCAVTGYLGRYVETLGLDLSTTNRIPVAGWEWSDDYLLALAVSRPLATVHRVFQFEPELGVAKRVGDMDEVEFWAAMWFRWTWFPWNDYVRTSLALATGLSLATGISDEEVRLSENGEGSHLLHYLGGELTFALAAHPDWELLARFHHRSGANRFKPLRPLSRALFNSTYAGVHYFGVGMRKRF